MELNKRFFIICLLWLLNLALLVYGFLYENNWLVLLWVFFIATLLHELGHMVAAIYYGYAKGLVTGWYGLGVHVDDKVRLWQAIIITVAGPVAGFPVILVPLFSSFELAEFMVFVYMVACVFDMLALILYIALYTEWNLALVPLTRLRRWEWIVGVHKAHEEEGLDAIPEVFE